jgi:hypothetical protein
MSKVNYHVLANSLVVSFDGKHFNIAKYDVRFQPVLNAIKDNRLADIPKLVDVKKAYAATGFTLKDNQLIVDDEPVHGVIVDRIIQFQSEGLPFAPLIKFIRKLRNNPSFNSREQLYTFLEHNGHPITSEGNFIAYRGVTDDLKDTRTKTFDNSPGSICEMPRNEVDDNPNNTCSKGLHVACYEYAKDFGPKLVEVEVDPQDVVTVPTDYNGTKMRVCKFKVVQLCEKINEAMFTESSYEATPAHETDVVDNPCWDNETSSDEEYEDNEKQYLELLQLAPSEIIKAATYVTKTKELTVNLHDGSSYVYENVPAKVVYEWEYNPSAGSYFTYNIAHQYNYRRI